MVCTRAGIFLLLAAILAGASSANTGPAEEAAAWYQVPLPDQSDWSAKRVATFRDATHSIDAEPFAVLEIPTASIEVAVYPDTVPGSLEGGVAWVSGTATPGSAGNAVIAGHRDGYFRPLEGIEVGTRISVRTETEQWIYRVTEIDIVDALDLTPLDPSDEQVLTLITCYPFRYQGYAPDRYIVRATAEHR